MYSRRLCLICRSFITYGGHHYSSNLNLSPSTSSALPSPTIFPSIISFSSFATATPTTLESPLESQVIKPLPQPNDDCTALAPQYISKATNGIIGGKTTDSEFDIVCNTNYQNGDFMSFYSPSLTTCIDGCALYNAWQIFYNYPRGLNCSGVTYVSDIMDWGNCFLKDAGYTSVLTQQNNITYAKLKKS